MSVREFCMRALRIVVNLAVFFTASLWLPVWFFYMAIFDKDADEDMLAIVIGEKWLYTEIWGE